MTTAGAPLQAAVAFRHVTGRGRWGRLIKLIAGPPVHCATVVIDASGALHAWHATQGIGVEPLELTPDWIAQEAWEIVPVAGVDAHALARWCAQRVRSRYDTLGAVLYFTPLTSRDRWTCSEFSAEGLVACGGSLSLINASQTPRRLRRALRSELQARRLFSPLARRDVIP